MGEVSRWSWAAVGMFSGFAGLTVVAQPAILYLMKELFTADEIYFVTVAIQLLAMGITLALSTVLGYLSQPERWGRKTVVAVWCLLQVLVTAVPVYVSQGRWVYAGVRAFTLATEQLTFGLASAWITDHCSPDRKGAMFTYVLASAITGATVGAGLAQGLSKSGVSNRDMPAYAFYNAVVALVFVVAAFPRDRPVTARPVAAVTGDVAQYAAPERPWQVVREVLTYFWRERFGVIVIFFAFTLSQSAQQGTMPTFLQVSRGWSAQDLAALMVPMFLGSAIVLWTLPSLSSCGVKLSSPVIVFLAMTCAPLNFAYIGLCTSKTWFVACTPLMVVQNIGIPFAISLLSGEGEKQHRDQGTLIGVANGIGAIASLVGSVAMAPLLTATEKWSPEFVGTPYLILAATMLPAWGCAVKLFVQRNRSVLTDDGLLADEFELRGPKVPHPQLDLA